MTQNVTLKIDETGDLVIGEDGIMETLSGIDTTAQNIRMNLKTGIGDFHLFPAMVPIMKKFLRKIQSCRT